METVLKDQKYVWHPFTQMKNAQAIPITHAKGLYLYSEDGKRYLDGISSWWVNLHGHGHPYIIEKIHDQLQKLDHVIFADFTHEPAVKLAEKLLPLLPGNMSKLFYSDNGSTAVETALKMALQYWHNNGTPKTKIICLKHSYHGDTFGAMSAAGKNGMNKPFWKHLFDIVSIDPPLPGQERESLEQLEQNIADAACFIFEPLVLGVGGMKIYTPQAIEPLLKLCHDHQVLTIADEVMTGFGRLNTLFASEELQTKPDIICLAKGLTGGVLPLAVTACSAKIYEAFLGDNLEKALLHGHSYTANPVACASALASLDLLLQTRCTNQRKMIADCHQQFVAQSSLKLKRFESIGTILVMEFYSDNSSYFSQKRNTLYHHFLNHSILLRPLGNVLFVMPPYCITEEELNNIYNLC